MRWLLQQTGLRRANIGKNDPKIYIQLPHQAANALSLPKQLISILLQLIEDSRNGGLERPDTFFTDK
jgi:hypothetical protein